MSASEGLNDIVEDPNLEWDDDGLIDGEEDIEDLASAVIGDENESKVNLNADNDSQTHVSVTNKSLGSSIRSDLKRTRVKANRPPVFNFTGTVMRRDPAVESIIESRKLAVIENTYTRLAQVSTQAPRGGQRMSSFEIRPGTSDTTTGLMKERIVAALSAKRLPSAHTTDLDKDDPEDGSLNSLPQQTAVVLDKTGVELYLEKCERLNICPCSMVIRSIYTTRMNLQNYGLGPRGCIPLAVALARNTTIVSLNLAGNNIGSSGMSYIYQVMIENTYIEEIDLSFNNLGTNGICKVAEAISLCVQLKRLGVAGNELTASDVKILLIKVENHSNLKNLNLSYNQLDEQGGIHVAECLQHCTLSNLDISWCCIRSAGAKAIAKALSDNNGLISLDISYNSFTNDTLPLFAQSFEKNNTLEELNFRGNQLINRFDVNNKDMVKYLTTGVQSQLYKMLVAASTNHTMKIIRLGQNHIEGRCLMIILRALTDLPEMSIEELDLTGLAFETKDLLEIPRLFDRHNQTTCYFGPIRQTIDHFANNLLNEIENHCRNNDVTLTEIFNPNEESYRNVSVVTYEQFRECLKKAKIPYPSAYIDGIMKYLGKESEPGTISLKTLPF